MIFDVDYDGINAVPDYDNIHPVPVRQRERQEYFRFLQNLADDGKLMVSKSIDDDVSDV